MKTASSSTNNSGRVRLRRWGYAFCPRCGKSVELMSFDEAARSFNTDVQDIEILAKHGDLHRLHNRRAQVMICSVSLFEFFESRQTRLLESHFINSLSIERNRDIDN